MLTYSMNIIKQESSGEKLQQNTKAKHLNAILPFRVLFLLPATTAPPLSFTFRVDVPRNADPDTSSADSPNHRHISPVHF